MTCVCVLCAMPLVITRIRAKSCVTLTPESHRKRQFIIASTFIIYYCEWMVWESIQIIHHPFWWYIISIITGYIFALRKYHFDRCRTERAESSSHFHFFFFFVCCCCQPLLWIFNANSGNKTQKSWVDFLLCVLTWKWAGTQHASSYIYSNSFEWIAISPQTQKQQKKNIIKICARPNMHQQAHSSIFDRHEMTDKKL